MRRRSILIVVLLFISACNEQEASPQPAKRADPTQPPVILTLSVNGKFILQGRDTNTPPQLLSQAQSLIQYAAINTNNVLTVSLRDASHHDSQLASFIARSGCALYSVSTLGGEERCVAPNIFAELPENSPDSPLGFDRDGNLLVIGRRFVTSHTDTCLQPTRSGCAAWQVDYQLEPVDGYARLFRIVDGQALEMAPNVGGIALASYTPRLGATYLLSGTFYGYELETELGILATDGLSTANLGKASSLLASDNGLLFVDHNHTLQFSHTTGLTQLGLPSDTLSPDQWFNPSPQKLAFDEQGQLYGLFQQRRRSTEGEWHNYLLTYRLLPYAGKPLGGIAVADTFFTETLARLSAIPLATGFAFIDCNEGVCKLLTQTPNTITTTLLPANFITNKLSADHGEIILDGHTSNGQLMQLIFTSSQDGAVSEKSRTLFPLDVRSVITLPSPSTTTELASLHITSMTLLANNLTLSFNQNLKCTPQQVFIHNNAERTEFSGAMLIQTASLHLLQVPSISDVELVFECEGEKLHLRQPITEDSLAI